MRVLFGCPLYERAWILQHWFQKIENQGWPEEDLGFCFLYGPSQDDTLRILLDYQNSHPKLFAFEIIEEQNEKHERHEASGLRRWNQSRYLSMSRMRNKLLNHVSAIEPDLFVSLDTDLLLETPGAIDMFIESLNTYDLVGLLTYMTPHDVNYPSVMTWDFGQVGGHANRQTPYPIGYLFEADVVMAGKAMRPEVFKTVRYYPHEQGEDLGFSANAKANGFRVGCDSRIFASHIMSEYWLPQYEAEGDPRQPSIATNIPL